MKQRILIIEDEAKIIKLLKLYLEKENFKTLTAQDGSQGLSIFRDKQPDLVILDLMLPRKDGISLLKEIRQTHDTPVIILSSKDEETDKVIGLELGADDYVTKPFSPKELVARIKSVLRRFQQSEISPQIYQVKNLKVDPQRFEVKQNEQKINLTRREFDVLLALIKHPGVVYSRAELLDIVYANEAAEVYDRTIDVHISNLRKKLKDHNQELIATIKGVGYKLLD